MSKSSEESPGASGNRSGGVVAEGSRRLPSMEALIIPSEGGETAKVASGALVCTMETTLPELSVRINSDANFDEP